MHAVCSYVPVHFKSPVNVSSWVRGGNVELNRFALSSAVAGYTSRGGDTQQGVGHEGLNWEEHSRLELARSHWHRGR